MGETIIKLFMNIFITLSSIFEIRYMRMRQVLSYGINENHWIGRVLILSFYICKKINIDFKNTGAAIIIC